MRDSSEQGDVLISRQGAVGIIALDRAARMNAINNGLRAALPAALARLDAAPDLRAIVLHGGAGRAFCVGADITEARPPMGPLATFEAISTDAWIDAFDRCATPVIAAVHGFCLGGGLEMALACDLRLASPCAQFALPETNLGLIPGAGGTQRLPRLIGLGRAMDLLLTGDRIDAPEAHRIGLVNRLSASRDSLLPEAIALAEKIAAKAPLASRYVKQAAREGLDLPLAAGLARERSLFALLSATTDKIEAAKAFAEKRAPRFTGQ